MMNPSSGRKSRLSLSTKRSLYGYAFIAPFLIGFIFLILSPLILYGVMGFSKVSAGDGGMELSYVGTKNFEDILFRQTDFFPNIAASLSDLLLTGTCVIIFSFFMAVLLNQKFHGRAFVRAIFFLPVVIASGACALSQSDALSTSALSVLADVGTAMGEEADGFTLYGFLIQMLQVSVDEGFSDLIVAIIDRFYTVVMMSGVQILIFLAGLQGISPSLYEASRIDGATGWESFWKITFPMIGPLILVNSVYTVVDYMSGSTNLVINQMYKLSSEGSKYGLSSAMGLIYFGLVYLLLGVVFAIASRLVHYED